MSGSSSTSKGKAPTSSVTNLPSTSTSGIKLDIKKLTGQSNYVTWRANMMVYLEYLDVADIIDGTPAPSTDSSTYPAWQKKDRTARLAILMAVDDTWLHIVSASASANAPWTALQNQFDRHNVTSVHHLLHTFVNTKMDKQTLPEYLNHFDQTWTRLQQRVQNASSDDNLANGLKTMLSNSAVKASFLQFSLPDTYNNIVDNLVTKKVDYDDAYTHLLDLPSPSSGSALSAQGTKKKSDKKQQSVSSNQLGKNECSFCKKWKRTYTGHTFKTCTLLKDFKDGKNFESGQANIAISGVALVSCEAPTIDGQALSASKTTWALDTAASHHITSNLSQIQSPVAVRIGIKIGNGSALWSTHSGTVNLCVNVSHQMIPVSLSGVLCIPE